MLLERIAARAAALAVCAVSFLCLACADQPDGPPRLVLHTDTASATFGAVDVVGLDATTLRALNRAAPSVEQWHGLLTVHTVAPTGSDTSALPLLGRYAVIADRLRFTPRFPPASGQTYKARFDGAAAARISGVAQPATLATLDTAWSTAAVSAPASTSLVEIFPTSDTLPVNLLRVYLHFSAPMSMGEAYRRVRLLDERGQEVPDAFLVLAGDKELWDPQRQRLTLLFDPGRIKRDLRPNLELGLPLREGHSFTLAIDSAWQDARGLPLLRPFHKRFTVVAADRQSPRTEDWKVTAPAAGNRDALVLRFPESLDRALLERLLTVTREDGSVPGVVTVDEKEKRWRFAPVDPWQAGLYHVQVGTELEDLAGNSLRRLFDVDRKTTAATTPPAQLVRIAFTVR